MNIEANLKKLKTSIKRRKKITLTLMLGFLMTGVIGYAEPTVEELQNKIIQLQTTITQQNERIIQQNEEIKQKNQEIEKRFKSEAVIAGKGAKIGSKEVPDEKIRGIAIGQEAIIDSQGGNDEDYSLAIGRKARVASNGLDFSSIALGDNANVLNGSGLQEWTLSFDSDNWKMKESDNFFKKLLGIKEVEDIIKKSKVPGGIAMGTNAFARTGSIQIGAHTYEGKMGDISIVKDEKTTVDTNRQANIVNMTTIGTNSYQKAANGTMVGAYNISTGDFTGEGNTNSYSGSQNFGSNVFGTLNSIRSKKYSNTSGVANSIVGIANTTENANGSLVFGAGNIIKNSNEALSLTDTVTESFKNVDDAVTKFQKLISTNKAGGATLAIGGANKADYTKQVSMIGTRNEVKGTKNKKTELVSVSGDNNLVENSRNIVAGKNFHVTGEGNILQGFNNVDDKPKFLEKEYEEAEKIRKEKLEKANKKLKDKEDLLEKNKNDPGNKLIYESAVKKAKAEIKKLSEVTDKEKYKTIMTKIKNNNVVALGNDIEINTDNSVYLGTNSTEAKDDNTLWRNEKDKMDQAYKEYAGFDHIGGIVTVGNDKLTRVIQNVAPGLISATSTDAINGSQLYKYVAKQYITVKDGKGNSTQVKLGDTLTLKGTTVDVTVKAPEPAQPTPVAPTSATPVTPTGTKAPEHTATFETKGNVGGSDTFGYKYRDDKGNETELKEGPDGKLYTNEFIQNNEYKNNKWVKKGSTEDSILKDNQYDKNDEKVILSTKYGKIITDVANGVKANDAVNVSQLKTVSTNVEKNTTDIQQLQKDVKEVDKKSDLALGGVANAVAIANLVQVNSYSDYRHNLSAAYGYYGGSHALAIGFSGVTKDRKLVYKLSGSVNNKGNLAFGVGAGVMLGNKEESMEHKDINVKELYEKISKLEKENSEFREMFKKLGVMK
ncbi:YadA-like family protein [uncultured Sneathia sp.]|uniref:YadA-like family protein n=1 Tax=uncultured Sneathia sp. TaxID=278067 RepID=UPI0025914AE9|nr:YadA-like family protein [uncultured Sneathia sp.]